LAQKRKYPQTAVADQQRVTVGRRLCRNQPGKRRGPIVDDHLLIELAGEAGGDETRNDIAAATRIRSNDAQWALRKILRLRWNSRQPVNAGQTYRDYSPRHPHNPSVKDCYWPDR